MSRPSPSAPLAGLIADLEALPSKNRLSDSDTEVIYAFAYQLAAQGHFENAQRYFSFLLVYRPTQIKYLAGAALCHKMLKRYGAAASLHVLMAAIEPDEPRHHLSIAECLLLQGQAQEARDTLALVVHFCQENPGHEQIAQRAEAIAALLSAQTGHAA